MDRLQPDAGRGRGDAGERRVGHVRARRGALRAPGSGARDHPARDGAPLREGDYEDSGKPYGPSAAPRPKGRPRWRDQQRRRGRGDAVGRRDGLRRVGGADFGAGFWSLVAGGGERGRRARALIDWAIGPVWEANHVWLIFVLVVLWTGFSAGVRVDLLDPLHPAEPGGARHRPARRGFAFREPARARGPHGSPSASSGSRRCSPRSSSGRSSARSPRAGSPSGTPSATP